MIRPWYDRDYYARRARLPAAMTFVQYGGHAILIEPLGNDDATRAQLRGAFERSLKARAKRLAQGGHK